MSITTVLGKISKEQAGIILPHEHLIINLQNLVDKPKDSPKYFYEKVAINNLYRLYSDPYAILDNAIIDDEDVLLRELLLFKKAGGDTIVDLTLPMIGRNPKALKRISEKSNVNIVMGCGEYVNVAHSELVKETTAKLLAKQWLEEINQGIDGIKAGVIGEIGTSENVTENEWKCVDAAFIASMESGLSIHFHTSLWGENGKQICDNLINRGLNPNKICIDHIDVDLRLDYLKTLLDKGVYIEFDNFGKEFFLPKRENGLLKGRFAYDLERAVIIEKLCKLGFEKQILITNDICLKSMLTAYGGNGYGHILNNITAMLKEVGLNKKTIDCIIKENPWDFLNL